MLGCTELVECSFAHSRTSGNPEAASCEFSARYPWISACAGTSGYKTPKFCPIETRFRGPMCGIAGIFEFDLSARPDARLLEQMTAAIAHRGPDDCGHSVLDNVALGHRRLSIIDLSASGHQPMSNDDGSLWIVYNGESTITSPCASS